MQSSVTYALSGNVENLTLTGAGGVNGTGNGLANTITGNSANNALTGAGGDDTYVVQNSGDVTTELANGGTDTWRARSPMYLPLLSFEAHGPGSRHRTTLPTQQPRTLRGRRHSLYVQKARPCIRTDGATAGFASSVTYALRQRGRSACRSRSINRTRK